jgi:hypothetical protein
MALAAQLHNGTIQYSNTTSTDSGGNTTDVFGPIVMRALFADGTLANQANQAYRDYQLLTNTTHTYTLSALPGSQSIVKMRMLFVQVLTTNTTSGSTLAIAPGGTHGWTGVTIGTPLVAGSMLLITWPALAGGSVVASTTDQITFTVSGTTEYIATFIGTNA